MLAGLHWVLTSVERLNVLYEKTRVLECLSGIPLFQWRCFHVDVHLFRVCIHLRFLTFSWPLMLLYSKSTQLSKTSFRQSQWAHTSTSIQCQSQFFGFVKLRISSVLVTIWFCVIYLPKLWPCITPGTASNQPNLMFTCFRCIASCLNVTYNANNSKHGHRNQNCSCLHFPTSLLRVRQHCMFHAVRSRPTAVLNNTKMMIGTTRMRGHDGRSEQVHVAKEILSEKSRTASKHVLARGWVCAKSKPCKGQK